MLKLYIFIPVLLVGFFLLAQTPKKSKYKHIFRNSLLSQSTKYELAPIFRGRVYYPRYFFIPSLKQYLVYSSVDVTGDYNIYANAISNGLTYAIIDEKGIKRSSFETSLRFSSRSGCFYGPHTYIPFLETGKIDAISYDFIHNKNLDLSEIEFEKIFKELYATADYVEFINLRASQDNIHQAGVIFKGNGKVGILLSGLQESCNMSRNSNEDPKTNTYYEDYYLPKIREYQKFPQSPASIEMIPLETKNTKPFRFVRTRFNSEFSIKKYQKESATGWNGIMELGPIPIYVPGESSGTTYVDFKTKGEIFKLKFLDIIKADFQPVYSLGLHTFELPEKSGTENSLVFLEYVQDAGGNKLGGGVYVVRPATTNNPSADIPADMTEEKFNTLPVSLQVALLDPEHATLLTFNEPNCSIWVSEIERLKNLTDLRLASAMTEIPDNIANFTKLESLNMAENKVQTISPKIAELQELKDLNLSSNKLTEFPKVILELKNLKRLNINFNTISSLPDEMNQLSQLQNLDMISTNITSLPSSMIEMEQLYIYDGRVLENKLPSEYKHLFDYKKTIPNEN
ncbi:leucine-rich repeat domain-containing protein [Flavobacterium adhaerens]|uniref:leucine-rich repeat domain-containing protein n=1 Tax=Flavobacterium adhaerens TaxID=3149043 RepID=UPI0032B45E43